VQSRFGRIVVDIAARIEDRKRAGDTPEVQ
jgi:hypothetical protein